MSAPVTLRRYTDADEAETFALWIDTWQAAYPQLDFAGKRDSWLKRWREEFALAPAFILAVVEERIVGLITLDPARHYVDQLAVATGMWGSPVAAALVDEVKRLSPARVELNANRDNVRALRFYEKQGFRKTRDDINPRAGTPIVWLRWEPPHPV